MTTHKGSYTPPKGRPTKARDERRRSRTRLPPTLEWILVGIALAALVLAAWYFSTGDGGGGPRNGAPVAGAAAAPPVPPSR